MFVLGAWLAQRRFGTAEYQEILRAVLDTIHPDTQSTIPGALEVSSAVTLQNLLQSMPASTRNVIKLFSLIFDSRTMVFVVHIRHGKRVWRRFVEMDADAKKGYLDEWRSDPVLSYGAHIFRILSSYSYYIKEQVYHGIGYNGELLRRSYLE